jgi:PEP-CTERM motif
MSPCNPDASKRASRPGALAAAAALAVVVAAPATVSATTFVDPAGDFLVATYTGPQNSDLDIVAGSATYTSTHLRLSLTMNGAIGSSTATPYYLWGVNRGSGTDRLLTSGPPPIGPPDILFDAVVRLDFDGNGRVVTFTSAVSPPAITLLAPSVVKISGNTVSAEIPWSLLPSTGFVPAQYTYIAWSRNEIGSQHFIADLAPDAGSVTAVPEPATWGLMAVGLLVTGIAARGRRARSASALLPTEA